MGAGRAFPRLMRFCLDALDIRTEMVRSSELGVEGRKSEMILNLCKRVGARTYLGGMGGSKDYLDGESFQRAGIGLEFQDFQHPRYLRHPPDGQPVPGLSALDLLFNCGPSSTEVLFGRKGEA